MHPLTAALKNSRYSPNQNPPWTVTSLSLPIVPTPLRVEHSTCFPVPPLANARTLASAPFALFASGTAKYCCPWRMASELVWEINDRMAGSPSTNFAAQLSSLTLFSTCHHPPFRTTPPTNNFMPCFPIPNPWNGAQGQKGQGIVVSTPTVVKWHAATRTFNGTRQGPWRHRNSAHLDVEGTPLPGIILCSLNFLL